MCLAALTRRRQSVRKWFQGRKGFGKNSAAICQGYCTSWSQRARVSSLLILGNQSYSHKPTPAGSGVHSNSQLQLLETRLPLDALGVLRYERDPESALKVFQRSKTPCCQGSVPMTLSKGPRAKNCKEVKSQPSVEQSSVLERRRKPAWFSWLQCGSVFMLVSFALYDMKEM